MRFVAASSLMMFAVLAAMGCSSSTTATTDPGLTRDQLPAVEQRNVNPDGVAYPTADLGTNARKGSIAGNRMANLRFLGYPTGVVEDGIKTVALSDFFDPQQKKFSIIHIQAAGSWCTYCQQEAREFTPEVAALQAKKIGWLTVLAEGTSQGKGASLTDLNKWIAQHKSPNPHAVDTDSQNLGIFFPAGGLPWNAILDARSMEILAVSVGYGGLDGTKADLDKWLAWVADAKNAPKP